MKATRVLLAFGVPLRVACERLTLRSTIIAVFIGLLAAFVVSPEPSSAVTGDVLREFNPPVLGNGRGMAYDGTYLYYTLRYNNVDGPSVPDTNIYKITTTGGLVATISTNPPINFGALAWDGTRLWGGRYTGGNGEFYTIDPTTGATTFQFSVDYPADNCADQTPGFTDGLSYDRLTGTLWASDDTGQTVFNLTHSGSIVRSFSLSPQDCSSGVATDGNSLWLVMVRLGGKGTNEVQQRTLDGTLLSSFSTSRSYEDAEFDSRTFGSKCAIWSITAKKFGYAEKITAFEVPCDTSGFTESHEGSPSSSATTFSRDPVNLAFGNFVHQHKDMAIPALGLPLEFERTYSSALASLEGVLGFGWTHNYNMKLEFESDEAVIVHNPDGRRDRYLSLGSGQFQSPPDVFDTLEQAPDETYTLTAVSQVEFQFKSDGKLTSITDRNGNATNLAYFTSGPKKGLLESVTGPGGRSLIFTYDQTKRLIKITDPLPPPDTRTVEIAYDANDDLATVTDVKKEGDTTYTYSDHRLETITDANGHLAVQNCYDPSGRVFAQFNAPPSSQDCNNPDPSVEMTEFLYDTPASGKTKLTDPRGFDTVHTFDIFFRTTEVKDALNGVTQFDYDANDNVACVTDQRGYKTAYAYDERGNVTQVTDALNTDQATCQPIPVPDAWTFEYTTLNDIAKQTDPLERVTDYEYDTDGNLTRLVRRESDEGSIKSLTCFERNDDGLVTAIVESTDLQLPPGPEDPCMGNTTEFEYDTYGNQAAVIDPRFSGQPTSPKTTFTYDLGGRTLTGTNELDETTTYTYDAQNNVLTVEDELGNTTSNTYNAKGKLETVTDANRQPVSTPESGADCGAAGTGDGDDDDSDQVIDDGCPSAIYVYDDADRLVEVIDALGNSTTYAYDAVGNRTSVTNANRQPVGDPETGTDCGTAGTGDGVDDDSDTVKDDGCPSAIYAYDELNRLESETDALGRVTSYEYDAAGNLIGRTDARDLDTDYTYDALGRLTLLEHYDGETLEDDVDYTYDDVGNRLTMVDDTGTTEYEYDALDRPTSVTFPGDDTVSNEYGEVGDRTKITYPDTKEVDYTYDEAHNLETVTDWLSNQTAYDYRNDGSLWNADLPNDTDTDYTYDNAGRLESVANVGPGPTTISSVDYTLDAVGNRTEMEDLDGTHSYEYDPLYRLTDVTYPDPETDTYTYDAVGNRRFKNLTEYTYDDADQLTDVGGVAYSYDQNGNLEQRGPESYVWDHENELDRIFFDEFDPAHEFCDDLNGDGRAAMQDVILLSPHMNTSPPDPLYDPFFDLNGNGTINMQDVILGYVTRLVPIGLNAVCPRYFEYNGDGLRTEHTMGKFVTDYTWDLAGGLPLLLQETKRELHCVMPPDPCENVPADVVSERTYVYGLDLISATDAGGVQTYYLYDGLGSTTDLTDDTGNVLTCRNASNQEVPCSYTYDVFGEVRSGPLLNQYTGWEMETFLFTGEQYDAKARKAHQGQPGLYYLRARYYDPSIGRFLSQDPLPTRNLYAYVRNNPVNYIDPAGLNPCLAAAPAAAAATAGTGGTAAVPVGGGMVICFVGATAVALCAADGTCRGLVGDLGETIAGGVKEGIEEFAGFAKGLFSKGQSRKDLLDKWEENLMGAWKVGQRIANDPCSPARNHWERNLYGILDNKVNRYGAKLGLNPVNWTFPQCENMPGVALPDLLGSDSAESKE